MVTPRGQVPTFWPKVTLNMVIIQTTAWFGTIDNAKYSQIYIQDQTMMTTRQNELQNREGGIPI